MVPFQSTLPHGSDAWTIALASILDLFQSTLPHGSDLSDLSLPRPPAYFNPRSLTGATMTKWSLSRKNVLFQSTLPHGSDAYRVFIQGGVFVFQSTLPHGSDTKWILLFLFCEYFNPRSLTGATPTIKAPATKGFISIHAPSRERPGRRLILTNSGYFNPRSLTGATKGYQEEESQHAAISIHAPSRERPCAQPYAEYVLSDFNPRSLTGATVSCVN